MESKVRILNLSCEEHLWSSFKTPIPAISWRGWLRKLTADCKPDSIPARNYFHFCVKDSRESRKATKGRDRMSVRTTIHESASSIPEITAMVHDLRNPLTTIHGGAEMLVSSSLSGPQIHRLARNMYGATIRMKELL